MAGVTVIPAPPRIDGLEPGPDSDAYGFIVRWSRYGWNDGRPSLKFARQLAVAVRATRTDLDNID